MTPSPIKRSNFLVALSRDHHAGLLFCWKIKEGLKKKASFDRIADYAGFFWRAHLYKHFREEEILLFNQVDSAFTRRAKQEHATLEKIFRSIAAGELEDKNYAALADQLIGHIRFEERELFPYLENALPLETLGAIRYLITQLHSLPFEDNYPDEFWII